MSTKTMMDQRAGDSRSPVHSVGPWQAWSGQLHPDGRVERGVFRPGNCCSIRCDHDPDLWLIAASPELLRASEALLIGESGAWDRLARAVDKARGRVVNPLWEVADDDR